MGWGDTARLGGAIAIVAALAHCSSTPASSDAGADAATDASADAFVADSGPDVVKEPGPSVRIACWGSSRAPEYNFAGGSQVKTVRTAIEDVLTMTWDPMNTLDALGSSSADGVILTTYGGTFGTIVPALTASERNALRTFVDAGHFAILLLDNDGYGGPIDPYNDSLANPFGIDATGTLVLDGGFAPVTPVSFDGGAHPIFAGVSSMVQYYPGWLGVLADAGAAPTVIATNESGAAVDVFEKGALSSDSGVVIVFSDTGSFTDDVPGGLTAEAEQVFVQAVRYAAGK
jgi:hypothetical protein